MARDIFLIFFPIQLGGRFMDSCLDERSGGARTEYPVLQPLR